MENYLKMDVARIVYQQPENGFRFSCTTDQESRHSLANGVAGVYNFWLKCGSTRRNHNSKKAFVGKTC